MNKVLMTLGLALLGTTQLAAQSTQVEVYDEARAITEAEGLIRAEARYVREYGRFLESRAAAYERIQHGNAQAIANAQAYEEATRQSRQQLALQGLAKRIEQTPPRRMPANLLDRNGVIAWPQVLLDKRYRDQRERVEELFQARAGDVFVDTGSIAGEIHEACGELAAELDARVLEIGNANYLATARFLRNLAYESRFSGDSPQLTAKRR